MKKLIVLILAALVLLTGCSTNSGPYTAVTSVEAQRKLEEKQSFVLVYGSATCSACNEYKEIMKKVVDKYDVEVYFLEVTQSNSSEVTSFIKNSLGSTETSTPQTFVVIDGVVKSKTVGTQTQGIVEKLLVQYGFVDELIQD